MVIYFSKGLAVLFAVEELCRLYEQCHKKPLGSYFSKDGDIPLGSERFFLMLESEWKQRGREELTIKNDGLSIVVENEDVFIIGAQERSLLYGVYHYAEIFLGYSFVGMKESQKASYVSNLNIPITHNPRFQRRGNVIETIRDTQYVKQLIDWGIKNGLNEFFFTFFLWNEIGPEVVGELEKRNYNVTLGGHSLSFLLGRELEKAEERTVFFDRHNIDLHDVVISRIIEICKAYPIVNRISLWPEDVGIQEKNYDSFMPSYIAFVEKLKDRLDQANLSVDVEHIAYNAGLEWSMLERNKHTTPSSKADVLYAYWGRNYKQSLLSQEKNSIRAYQALLDWDCKTKDNQTELTVLEYYSDHFMLSELFPPLLKRIEADMEDYSCIGVNGVLNLIVPIHQKKGALNQDSEYPWKWVQMINNYFYAGLSWGRDIRTLRDRFFVLFGEKENLFRQLLSELEDVIAEHTYWNIPLFPARIVDPEKVSNKLFIDNVIHYLDGVYAFLEDHSLQYPGEAISLPEEDLHDFPSEEMLSIYLYHVQKKVETIRDQWRQKT
ncbi:hypothetical protein [Ornithinibacillus scapharcae]|uniref:hypothetical protein n=1 Tax=Ornithinibacillus scapharcae TaxID=1147159 RepID=UPI000225AA94|nr:hypothetical protein [Ornithinibacillus scapharcae]